MLTVISPGAVWIQRRLYFIYFLYSFIFSAGKPWPDNCLSQLWLAGESAGFPNSRVRKYFILSFHLSSRFPLKNEILFFSGAVWHRAPLWLFSLWCPWGAGSRNLSVPSIVSFGFDFTLHMLLLTGTHSVVQDRDVAKISCFVGWFCSCQFLLSVTLEISLDWAQTMLWPVLLFTMERPVSFRNLQWYNLVGLGIFYWLFLPRGKLMFPLSQTLKISHGSYPQGIKNRISCHCDFISALFKEN